MTDKEPTTWEIVERFLRDANNSERLPEVIGKALGKTAVLLVTVDVSGAILIQGNHNDKIPSGKRDGSMINQMSQLLATNMENMMKMAGRAAKEGD